MTKDDRMEAEMESHREEQPYWATQPNIAPIKSEFVLWDTFGKGLAAATASSSAQQGTAQPPPPPMDDDDAAEGRPSGSASKGETSDLSRSTEDGPPRKKQRGANKGRTFIKRGQEEGPRLCPSIARGLETCERKQSMGEECSSSHDLKEYLRLNQEDDLLIERPDYDAPRPQACPLFEQYGACPFGFKCRFLSSHVQKVADGKGYQDTGLELTKDFEKLRLAAPGDVETDNDRVQWLFETRGEMNVVGIERIKQVRGTKAEVLPITKAYLNSIGEPLDSRPNPHGKSRGGGRGGRGAGRGGRGRGGRHQDAGWSGRGESAANGEKNEEGGDAAKTSGGDGIAGEATIVSVSSQADTPDVPLRAVEKRRLHFEGGLYLAPLTTVGNLPFRRLCTAYGADITCGEMGLAQEYIAGNKNEWSLVRRHSSEKKFGVQLCGNRPQTLVATTEMLVKECPNMDFIDVNLGCPIDLVVKKGAGSALLDSAGKLGKILKGMNYAAGDVPVTIKMRTGIKTGVNTTHKLMPRAVKEWGVGALTIHGRTQQQRYSKSADYDYIKTCVTALRDAADEIDMPAIPIFGNGDAYDHRSYWQNVEETGVDGIMVARGALIKPWLFTELKERRDWDISARERLDMVGELAKYGLEHWGSDSQGINITRRFMCEALSFTYRYVPVGLLERLPARMNDRPYPFKGRDKLETLLASDNSEDWVNITSMFLGPPSSEFSFVPKHKSNSYGTTEESNG